MPLQFTFDGGLALRTPVSQPDCDAVLESCLPQYREEAARLGCASTVDETVRRIAFAILSVHSNFNATVRAWQHLDGVSLADWPAVYQTLRRTPLVQYPMVKTRALARLHAQVYDDGECLLPDGDDLEYRDYMRRNVWGLAWSKASFAVMLVKGQADVCCIDTHMHRLFTGKVGKGIGKRLYLDLEGRVRQLAERHEAPTSVVQHCLWDAMRGVRSPLLP